MFGLRALFITIVFVGLASGADAQTPKVRLGSPQPVLVRFQNGDDEKPAKPNPENGKDKDDDAKNGKNDKDEKNGKDKEDKEKDKDEPRKHTRDQGFLVEEAFNQDGDEIQHIFNWINTWTRVPGGRSRAFLNSYTMEIPLGSQKHQFSFTLPFITSFQHLRGQPAEMIGDIGDVFLNYRYQLLSDDEFLWMAPRFTVIAPTGDTRFGTGLGQPGYQFNLPISKYAENFDFHFNAGYTVTPNVSLPIVLNGVPGKSPRHDLSGYNLGGTILWKPNATTHFFVETLALWNDQIEDTGRKSLNRQLIVNPGFRVVVTQMENIEWVLGLSVPIGLTRDTPDIGVFVYMSVEHIFRKMPKDDKE